MRKCVSVGANITLEQKLDPAPVSSQVEYIIGTDPPEVYGFSINFDFSVLPFSIRSEEDFEKYLAFWDNKSKKISLFDFTLWGLNWESFLQTATLMGNAWDVYNFDKKMQNHKLPRQLRPF